MSWCFIFFVLFSVLAVAQPDGAAEPVEKGNPIGKVVGLIQNLKEKIEVDGKAEEKVYNKFACWCEDTSSCKATAIHQAFLDIKSYATTVLESKGKVSTRENEIAKLSSTIRNNQKSEDQANKIRQKENGHYEASTAEMKQTLGGLERAIKALTGAASLVQTPAKDEHLLQAAAQVHLVIEGLPRNLPSGSVFSPKAMALLRVFAKRPEEADYYDKKAKKEAAYNPQSGSIQGILKDMYDTFSQNLEKSTETEAVAQKNYENLMSVKAKEMHTLSAEKRKKEEEKAEYEGDEADAAQSLDDTQKQMKADTYLFDAVKVNCGSKAAEWNERVRARTEELHGINKALGILTSDDPRALLHDRTASASFLQIEDSHGGNDPRTKAWRTLKAHATKANSLRLAAIASRLRLGGQFDAAIAAIDKMTIVLKAEEKEDIEQRDWCKEETFKNEQEASRYAYKVEKFNAKITKLNLKVEELEIANQRTIALIADTTGNIESMETQRIDDHKVYEATKADDEGAAELLGAAIESMSAFYENKESASMLQKSAKQEPEFAIDEDAAPDASFSDAGQNSGEAGGIVTLMTMIKEDLEDEIALGTKTEIEAQTNFEKELTDAKILKANLLSKKTNLEADIVDKTKQIADIEVLKEGDEQLLVEEREYLASIKPDCDFILNAFDNRRETRAQEMDGLWDAKTTLQGASEPEAMVDVSTRDESFAQMGFLHR